jgi:hypothetical protein
MKFTALIAFLLLPWAVVVEGRANIILVSLGVENSVTVLSLAGN